MRHIHAFCLAGAVFVACRTQASGPATQVAVRGLRQALSAAPLAAFTVADAKLTVTCRNGHQDEAPALALDTDPLVFADVDACGPAHLRLSVQVRAAVGAVTAYVGDADASLDPGAVAVTFDGPLYGEIAFSPVDGNSYTCSMGSDSLLIPPAGLTVPLPVGDYVFDCSGPSGSTFSVSTQVVVAQRTPIALPFSGPSDATLASLGSSFGALQPPFDPGVTDYTLLLSSRRASVDLTATPRNPLATAFGQAGNLPQTISLPPLATVPVTITVTAADGVTTQAYNIAITRGLVSDMKVSPVAFGDIVFSWDTPRYDLIDQAFTKLGDDALQLTVTTPPQVVLSVDGTAAASDQAIDLLAMMEAETIFLVEASAPGGETDSYWIRFFDSYYSLGHPLFPLVALASHSSDFVDVQSPGSYASAASSMPTSEVGMAGPSDIVAAKFATDMVIYFSGDLVSGGRAIGWATVDTVSGPEITPRTAQNSGSFTEGASFAPMFLAVDPKQRFLFASDGSAVDTLTISAVDGSLSAVTSLDTGQANILQLIADPLGRFLYILSAGGILPAFVNPDGTLTPGTFFPVSLGASRVAISPDGSTLVFIDSALLVNAYALDPLTGALAGLRGSVSTASLGLSTVSDIAVTHASAIDVIYLLDSVSGLIVAVANADLSGMTSGYLTSQLLLQSPVNLAVDTLGDNLFWSADTWIGNAQMSTAIDVQNAQNDIVNFGYTFASVTLSTPSVLFFFEDWFGAYPG